MNKDVISLLDFKVEIKYNQIQEIKFIKIDKLYYDLLNYGNLTIGGLLLLKKDVEVI